MVVGCVGSASSERESSRVHSAVPLRYFLSADDSSSRVSGCGDDYCWCCLVAGPSHSCPCP